MLAEMMAFNAAFTTITKFVSNGKAVGDAVHAIGKLVSAEEDLRARGDRKKSSFFSNALGKSEDDFQEFVHLREIKEKRKELESICRLYAKPGTWSEFLAFEAKMRVKRKKEAQEREANRVKMLKIITILSSLAVAFSCVLALYYFTVFLKGL